MVGIRVRDAETGERVFNHDQFVTVVGERRAQLNVAEVPEAYRRRFDLEVTNRLMKQELFLEGYQTPAVEHLVQLGAGSADGALAALGGVKEVGQECAKWQQCVRRPKAAGERKTAAETRKGLEKLLLSFERKEFEPKKCQKGKGRPKGWKQTPRERYPVVRKWQPEEESIKNGCQRE